MKLLKKELHLLMIGFAGAVFLAVGASRVVHSSNDFVPVYSGALCLLHGCNPYNTSQLEQQFFAAGGRVPDLPSWEIDVPVYPPSTFLVLSPLALLQFPTARIVWFVLNGCLFVTAAALVAFLCPPQRRWAAAILVSLFLVASSILLVLGQPALLAISLLVIGTSHLLRGRLLPVGSALLMLSLAVKPQIGGLIVLYLLVRGAQRRYAAVALGGAFALLLLGGWMLQTHPHSADWPSSLRANLSATLSPGGSADPRPANQQAIGDVNLQALTSIFFVPAGIFNPAAYVIFLALLMLFVMASLGGESGMDWLALGALTVLSLLPVYHRFYDTRMLLLTVPALLIVSQKRRRLGAAMTALTLLSVVSVQYRVQLFLLQHEQFQTVLQHKLWFTLLLRQQSLELLVLFALYLVAMFSFRSPRALAGVRHDEQVLALHR